MYRAGRLGICVERCAHSRIASAMIPRSKHPIPFRRRLTAMFTERLALKSLSVLLALVLWFVVAAREPREEYAPVRFSPRLDSALVLRDAAPPIRAHVLGRPSEI